MPRLCSDHDGDHAMMTGERSQRPGTVTFAVVLMYMAGITQILLGILTIFLRYAPDAQSQGVTLPITLLGAGMVLFGLLVIGLASGVARGSSAARQGATAVMLLGLAFAVLDLLVAADGDWSAVISQSIASFAVVVPLWTGRGRRYFER
ncbi:hypothetical protein [Paenarthrobacter ilicis]|uniref:Lysylphosphatidylglycerol synthetase-like protein (DUF2156 family) n=1 Tax=Paenarthrobacter ilicis TaxID=43665 RepID=A0ABX0TIJ3_9MICC|nr:hypothetical protein [Paenarthrobacter ilicis]MBM7794544.1 lysylphosphatidylglycerol synthetase-like protein (DUF2156 family) [Paenarthrobacter ilicis]NIJ02368.1 lysylphosphatidylglycerol synthetase-like protein (DUF2156 family) [Paenarthrobacter ilicis]